MSAVEPPPLQELVAILDRAQNRTNDTDPNPDVKWRVELPLTTEEYQRFFAIIRGSRNPPPALRFDLTLVGHGYQVDVFQNGASEGSECADFAGTHDEVRLRERFAEAILGAIRALTKLL